MIKLIFDKQDKNPAFFYIFKYKLNNSFVPFSPKPPIYIVKGGDGQMAKEVMNESQLRIEYNHGMDFSATVIMTLFQSKGFQKLVKRRGTK